MKVLRQLCVLLIFANVGIALWWYFRTDVISYSKPETEPGVPSLILHQEFLKLEHGKQRLQSSACWMIGPFASEGAMQHAMQTLEYVALDMQHRKTMLSDSQGYQVSLPPSADRKQAEILLDKLRNAGIENPGIIEIGRASCRERV